MRRTIVAVLALLAVVGCHRRRHHDDDGGNSGNSAPFVVSTVPAAGATGVVGTNAVVATFNEDMAASTINALSFTLTGPGATPQAGTVSYDGATMSARFLPTAPFAPGSLFTARVTTAVTDLDGNAMSSDYTWSFTTTSDGIRPIVISTIPAAGATNVATNTKIVAYFNEALNPSTISGTSFLVTGPGTTVVTGTLTYDAANRSIVFDPDFLLTTGTTFTVRITTSVEDVAGNSMTSDYVWSFTTGLSTDVTPPTVTSTNPADGAIGVPINTTVTAFFSEAMDASTLTTTTFTFTLDQAGTPVTGTVTCPSPGSFATFTPDSNLAISMVYDATITIGVTDLAGNNLAVEYTWSFTTGLTVQVGPSGLDLQSADPFAILAGSSITSTGPTVITGNVGLSPGSSIGGLSEFPLATPGTVIGFIYGPGPIVDQAKLDLTSAYLDAASRSVDAISCPGNLGGLTLAPGLYTNSTSVMLSGTGPLGILTLDAGGDPTAVWIFQIGSTFTSDPATSIVLAGGALPQNIYWQIGTSATLGTTCAFKGNILAQESITLNTGATLDGRALTQTAAVTMDSNTVTKP
jgi:hypothetical protein